MIAGCILGFNFPLAVVIPLLYGVSPTQALGAQGIDSPPPGELSVSPVTNVLFTGIEFGPVAPSQHLWTLSNVGGAPIEWAIIRTNCSPQVFPDQWWSWDNHFLNHSGTDHGIRVGDTYWTNGLFGSAIVLDGESDTVRIPVSQGIDIGDAEEMTIELWLKLPNEHLQGPIIEWNDNSGFMGVHLWTTVEGARSLFANIVDTDDQHHILNSPPHLLQGDTWHHVALTYDRLSGEGILYLDGAIVDRQLLGSFRPKTNLDLWFGWRASTGHRRRLACWLDEVALYRRVLSESEIRSMATLGIQTKCFPKGLFEFSAAFGSLDPGNSTNVFLNVSPEATSLGPGEYVEYFTLTNISNERGTTLRGIQLSIPFVENDLSLRMVARPDRIDSGRPVHYEIRARNSGPDIMRDVVVTNLLDPAVQFLSSSNLQGLIYQTNQTLVWDLGELSPDQDEVATFQVLPLRFGGILTNLAWISGRGPEAVLDNNRVLLTNAMPPFGQLWVNLETNVLFRGPEGGAFIPEFRSLTLSNVGSGPLYWRLESTNCQPEWEPAAWWSLEGNALDNVSVNHGVLFGNLDFEDGIVGRAAVFDGINSAIRISASPGIDIGLGQSFTIETWVNPADPWRARPVLEWGDGTSIGISLWTSGSGQGTVRAILVDAGSVNHILSSPDDLIQHDTWHHIAVTYDGVAEVAVLYVDGQEAATSLISLREFRTDMDLWMGKRIIVNGERFFRGLIDEPALYDRALSSDQIEEIYRLRVPRKCHRTPYFSFHPSNGILDPAAIEEISVTLTTNVFPLLDGQYLEGVTVANLSNGRGSMEVLAELEIIPGTHTPFTLGKRNETEGFFDGSSGTRDVTFSAVEIGEDVVVAEVVAMVEFAKHDDSFFVPRTAVPGGEEPHFDEIKLILSSPSGTSVTLINNSPGSFHPGTGFFQGTITFDQAALNPVNVNPERITAGTFSPATNGNTLHSFSGEPANGTWTLSIEDDQVGHGLSFYSVAIELSVIPMLRVTRSESGIQATLSWAGPPGESFVLEEAQSLSPAIWLPSVGIGVNPITVDLSGPEMYFRLLRIPTNSVQTSSK